MDTTAAQFAVDSRPLVTGVRAGSVAVSPPEPGTALADSASPGSAAEPAYLAGPPLFWRLLAANLFVVFGGAVVGTALTRRFVLSGSFTPATHALMVLAAIALSAALTALILHVAFRPLRALREAIQQSSALSPKARPEPVEGSEVRSPKSSAFVTPPRVPLSRFDDPDIQAVAQAVNGLWDRLDQQVQLLAESNRRLEEQRRELAEKSAQLARLATMVLAAQEDERRRIARELHDGTMQSVAALIMGLERGLQAMSEDVPHLRAAHRTTARLRDLAVRTLDEIRHLAIDLRPAVLDDHGLVPALRWLAQEQSERTGLEVAVEAPDDAQRLPAPVETALFRIVQEALANVVKHAQAHRAAIRLQHTGPSVVVEVTDDGAGIPAGLEPPPGHMGLFNMRERAHLLGGACVVVPNPAGKGTLVRAQIPMPDSLPAPSGRAMCEDDGTAHRIRETAERRGAAA